MVSRFFDPNYVVVSDREEGATYRSNRERSSELYMVTAEEAVGILMQKLIDKRIV